MRKAPAGYALDHEVFTATDVVAHDARQSRSHGLVHDEPPSFMRALAGQYQKIGGRKSSWQLLLVLKTEEVNVLHPCCLIAQARPQRPIPREQQRSFRSGGECEGGNEKIGTFLDSNLPANRMTVWSNGIPKLSRNETGVSEAARVCASQRPLSTQCGTWKIRCATTP